MAVPPPLIQALLLLLTTIMLRLCSYVSALEIL